jgi:VanZ family protein
MQFRPSLLPSPPQRGTYALLAVFLALFVVYGSLVPLHYRPLSWSESLVRFRAVCATPLTFDSLSDWLTNIILFVPLGFVTMAALRSDFGWKHNHVAIVFVLPTCVLLSIGVEFAQLWFPPRVSSLNDIVAETLGAALGVAVWLTAGRGLMSAWQRMWGAVPTHDWAPQLLPPSIAVLILIEGWPLDLTIRPADLWHKYRAGGVYLMPCAAAGHHFWEFTAKHLQTLLFFGPVGVLLGNIRSSRWHLWVCWPRIFMVGFGLAAFVTLLQLLVESRVCDTTTLVFGTLAIVGGWAVSIASSRRALRHPHGSLRQPYRLLLPPVVIVLMILNWLPFDFSFDARFIDRRFHSLCLVPFVDYQHTDILHIVGEFLTKVFLWVPLGALVGFSWRAQSLSTVLLQWVPLLMYALGLELGQFFLRSRVASVSDVTVESAGAWIGLTLAHRGRIRCSQNAWTTREVA